MKVSQAAKLKKSFKGQKTAQWKILDKDVGVDEIIFRREAENRSIEM